MIKMSLTIASVCAIQKIPSGYRQCYRNSCDTSWNKIKKTSSMFLISPKLWFLELKFYLIELLTKYSTYGYTDIAVAPYGNYWRWLRKICVTELLSAARVHSFLSIREEEVLNLIKTIQANDGLPVDLSEKVFSMTYAITARAAFGKKCKDQEAFISVISEH